MSLYDLRKINFLLNFIHLMASVVLYPSSREILRNSRWAIECFGFFASRVVQTNQHFGFLRSYCATFFFLVNNYAILCNLPHQLVFAKVGKCMG